MNYFLTITFAIGIIGSWLLYNPKNNTHKNDDDDIYSSDDGGVETIEFEYEEK